MGLGTEKLSLLVEGSIGVQGNSNKLTEKNITTKNSVPTLYGIVEKEISQKIPLNINTLKFYKRRINKTLGAYSVTSAIAIAHQKKLMYIYDVGAHPT